MTIKAVGFDIGHTLIRYNNPLNWKALYPAALSDVLRACGIRKTNDRIAAAGAVLSKYNTRENYREYEVTSDTIFTEIFDAWGIPVGAVPHVAFPSVSRSPGYDAIPRVAEDCDPYTAAKEAFYGFFRADAAPFPDTVPTLDALRTMGIPMGFTTDVAYAMDNKYALKDIAEIRNYFDAGFTSTDIGFRKPNAAGYNALARALCVPAQQMMYVGDEEKDIVGANNVGMVSVLVNRSGEAKNWGQDYTVGSLCEIVKIISSGDGESLLEM